MNFKHTLETLLEKAIHSFNTSDYEGLSELFVENIHFTAPAYQNKIALENPKEFFTRGEVFNYWKRMHEQYPFTISKFEFLRVGKISIFRNTMPDFGYVIDTEIHFDEYGKVLKLYNSIHDTIALE